jgi:GT2 family glycosyltransferase
MQNPKVCIIITNWNGKKLLKNCLFSLFKLTDYLNYKVIVVDNGSTDGSAEFLHKKFPQVDVLVMDKNYGYAKGCNEGIKYALNKYNPDYFLLLNNDTKIIKRNWLKSLVNSSLDVSQPLILNPDKTIQNMGGGFSIFAEPYIITWDEEPFWISGVCMLIKKAVIKKIGFLDENVAEDLDFGWRARAAKLNIGCIKTSQIVHYGSLTNIRLREKYYKNWTKAVLLTIRKNSGNMRLFFSRILLSLIEFYFFLFSLQFVKSRGILNGLLEGLFSKAPTNKLNADTFMNKDIKLFFKIILVKLKKHSKL